MNNYIESAKEIYKNAAIEPNIDLCCTAAPIWQLPVLKLPQKS